MKVLVTGGSGYIGSHLVRQLLKENHTVVVLDNFSTPPTTLNNPRVTYYNADITNWENLKQVCKLAPPPKPFDAVVHMAALISVAESVVKPFSYFDVNTQGTINVARLANLLNIKTVVFSSTAAVYGTPPTNAILKEQSLCKPINPYGWSKLGAEHVLRVWKNLKPTRNLYVFRYFNVCGINKDIRPKTRKDRFAFGSDHLIGALNLFALGLKPGFRVNGTSYPTHDGTCVRDYVHVDDVARAHVLALKDAFKGGRHQGTYNLGGMKGHSIYEVLRVAESVWCKKVRVAVGAPRKGDPAFLQADNSKARQALNWTPSYNLEKMVRSDYDYRR